MKYQSLEQFFKSHLRFKQHWNKKRIYSKDAHWQILEENTWLDGCEYAKGSRFKCLETTNFGWIVFDPETLTPNGNTPGKRIIKW